MYIRVDVLPKVTYKCVDCGKERTDRSSAFKKIVRDGIYRCHDCAVKFHFENIPKKRVTYKCVDCGKERTSYPSSFNREKSPDWVYRCKKCASIKAQKEYWADPEKRAFKTNKVKEANARPDVKKKISDKAKIRWSNPDARSKQSKKLKEVWNEHGMKESASLRALEIQNRPEVKAKMSISKKKNWEDENYRLKTVSSWDRPGARERQSTVSKENWEQDGVKEKVSGENNCNWKGGTSFEPYCPKFNERKKEQVRKFFGYMCICCSKHSVENILFVKKKNAWVVYKLPVHHIDHDKDQGCDDKPFNLVPMCSECHSKEWNNEEEYRKYINHTLEEGFKWGIWSREDYEKNIMGK